MLAATALLLALQLPAAAPTAAPDSGLVGAVGPSVDAARVLAPDDTVRRRPRAIEVSEGYELRLRVHRYTAYAVPALFALQWAAGEKLYGEATGGADAPGWARDIHRPNAFVIASAFTVNAVTGAWNLWESRSAPGAGRRLLHGASMVLASGIFSYAASLPTATGTFEERRDDRRRHRTLALTGMGITLASGATMLLSGR